MRLVESSSRRGGRSRIVRRRPAESGYNLIEVIIAMAILSVVLLSVLTLFVMGQKNVYSGKQMTEAVAIGTQVTEDISSMKAGTLYAALGITSTSTLGSVDVDTTRSMSYDTYSNAILRTTNNITSTTDPSGYLQRWKDAITAQNKLGEGFVALVIQPSDTTYSGGTLTNTPNVAGTVVKVRVIVRWVEGLRPRQVIFDTTRFNRTRSFN